MVICTNAFLVTKHRKVELSKAGSTDVERMSREGNLAVESEETRQLGRPGIKQTGSIKMNLKKMGCKGQEGPGGCLISCVTTSFSGRTLFHGDGELPQIN